MTIMGQHWTGNPGNGAVCPANPGFSLRNHRWANLDDPEYSIFITVLVMHINDFSATALYKTCSLALFSFSLCLNSMSEPNKEASLVSFSENCEVEQILCCPPVLYQD
ncbi:hypothetical protein STEG23_015886 [Scotinomys teguina]